MTRESYNVLIAQMAATIYAGYVAQGLNGRYFTLYVDDAKQVAKIAGIEEPGEETNHFSRCGHDPKCEM